MSWMLVGNIAGDTPPQGAEIADHLAAIPAIELSHGGSFTGKPTTVIHADNHWVLKINRERMFQSRGIATAWCEKRLSQEREFGIYHPQRSWLVRSVDGERWQAANLSPRMQSLHTLDWSEIEDLFSVIRSVIEKYYSFSARFELRLDEGLSNFGRDGEAVYYLDDDIFAWDEHASFVAMLCLWLRAYSSEWLNEGLARRIGASVREILLEFRTPFDVELVSAGLKDQFVGNEAVKARDAMLEGLSGRAEDGEEKGRMPGIDWQKPVGLLADIHANLPALRAILEEMDRRGVSQWLVLGDVVGYGPHPSECIAELVARGAVCLRGNHDHYVGHQGHGKVAMSESARWAADWTIGHLNDVDRNWLAKLPLKIESEGILALHGAPVDRTFFNGYVYEMTYERNLERLAETGVNTCFLGHTHLPGVYAMSRGQCLPLCRDSTQNLAGFEHVLVNPGSVGQPRSGRPGAEAAIFDPAASTVEFIHLSYPIEETTAGMHREHFPDQLIQRLNEGS